MNDLQIFSSEKFGKIRALELDGDPWFCLADVCKPLGLRASKCKGRLKQDGVLHRDRTDSMGRPTKMLFVNEANLYRTIFQSTKEEAEAFVDWVTEEVLPALRRTGTYSTTPHRPMDVSPAGLARLITITRRVMLDMNSTPVQVGEMVRDVFQAYNFPVPSSLKKQLEGQISLFDRPELEAAQ